ncbi:MAG: hypothetical protein IKB42_00260 [Clostridia bacterium]|nr:hypothetical protein [Clostridia bacterium]
MKKLTCTQCGASINNDTLTCDYCGSVFFNSTKEENTKKKKSVELEFDVRQLEDAELARLCKNIVSADKTSNLFVLFFMFVWTGIAFGMTTAFIVEMAVFSEGIFDLIFVLVPAAFVVIGLSVIIKIFRDMAKGKITKELALIKKGEYQKAYESFTTRENKKHHKNYVACIILLDYFKLGNYGEAKQRIIQMSQVELSALILRSNVFVEIAQNLGVKTPTQYTNSYHHGGYSETL